MLTVDGSGAVSVEQAVAEVVLDGSQSIYSVLSIASLFYVALDFRVDRSRAPHAACDRLPVTFSPQGGETGINAAIDAAGGVGVCVYDGYNVSGDWLYFKLPGCSDIAQCKSWLSSNPATVVLPLATPQTLALGPITPPTVPAADAALWAASDVPCDLEATTWTASGAEQGRQQAAMVKVAQQVRQQAETVAALAAQSLEA